MPTRFLVLLALIALAKSGLSQPRMPTSSALVDSQTFLDSSQRPPAPPSADLTRRVHDLVERMTLEEKVGQMTQLEIGMVTDGKDADLQINTAKLRKAVVEYGVGPILNGKDLARPVEWWHELIAASLRAAGDGRVERAVLFRFA